MKDLENAISCIENVMFEVNELYSYLITVVGHDQWSPESAFVVNRDMMVRTIELLEPLCAPEPPPPEVNDHAIYLYKEPFWSKVKRIVTLGRCV